MNVWFKLIVGASALAGAGYYGYTLGDDSGYGRGHDEATEVQHNWDQEKLSWQAGSLSAMAEAFADRQMLIKKNQEITDAQAKLINSLRADNAGLRAERAGMHTDIAAFTAAATRGGQGGPAASAAQLRSAVATLGELLDESTARYESLAGEADLGYAAGVECERRYDTLTPK